MVGLSANVGTINRRKYIISSETAYRFLLVFVWTQNTVLNYITAFIKRTPIISAAGPLFTPSVIIIALLLSLLYIMKNIHAGDFIAFIVYVIVIISTSLIFPENWDEYISPQLGRIMLMALPMFFVGLAYKHEKFKNDLFWASLIGVIIVFLYQFYLLRIGKTLESDNMDTAYNVLPSVLYLIYWAFYKKKITYWAIAVISSVLSFVFGTRGPIFAILVFLAANVFLRIINTKNKLLQIVYVLICAVGLVLLFSGNVLTDIVMWMSKSFEKMGFSTRIFDYFINGEITYHNGRDVLYAPAIDAIKTGPLFGYGFMGDRVIFGRYVHNIFLEIWCSFGIIVGSLIILALVGLTVISLWKSRNKDSFNMILLLICMIFTKLMMSGSYATEPYFYLFIGVCVRELHSRKISGNQGA